MQTSARRVHRRPQLSLLWHRLDRHARYINNALPLSPEARNLQIEALSITINDRLLYDDVVFERAPCPANQGWHVTQRPCKTTIALTSLLGPDLPLIEEASQFINSLNKMGFVEGFFFSPLLLTRQFQIIHKFHNLTGQVILNGLLLYNKIFIVLHFSFLKIYNCLPEEA